VKRARKKVEPEIRVINNLTTVVDPRRAADLFGAMLRAVEMTRERKESEAEGSGKTK
jgi:hypothetical protein